MNKALEINKLSQIPSKHLVEELNRRQRMNIVKLWINGNENDKLEVEIKSCSSPCLTHCKYIKQIEE